jgi:hypothetical protein
VSGLRVWVQPVQGDGLSDVSMGPRLASQLLLQLPVCMRRLWIVQAADPLNPAAGSARTGFCRAWLISANFEGRALEPIGSVELRDLLKAAFGREEANS